MKSKEGMFLLSALMLVLAGCHVDTVGSATEAEPEAAEAGESFVCSYPGATFPGGEMALYEWIDTHMQYPPKAKEKGSHGRVFVEFKVGEDGTITDVRAVRGPDRQLMDEAVRLVKAMPRWIPATDDDGKAFSCRYSLPILFKLGDDVSERGI